MLTWNTTPRPILALAPMAGVTESAFRQIVKELAPQTILYSEFVSTDAIHFGSKKTERMLEFDTKIEHPLIVQIFGRDLERIKKACKAIEEMGADGIDINMGCPATKIVASSHGSALIREPELAAEIVNAVSQTVKIPASVKTRLGWENSDSLIPFCKKLEEAGASCIAVHGRTYKEKFKGSSDWEPIYELKKHLKIPVIGNGDIKSVDDAISKLKNLDGVMIGRAAMGNPWLMRDVSESLMSGKKCRASQMTFEEKIPVILRHLELSVEQKGEEYGIKEARKHLAQYIRGFDGAKEMRMKIMEMKSLDEIKALIAS